ncbi:hypothetical protein SAMN05216206_2752 [Pseudomonas guineae]|uniref:Uncharacterized protein n=1 Tax=Pseudomonas guineae TaxID=425504 RepID=A0A1I3K9Q4_9PSED|nr:hypothetical protein [Pseudomonas guineae]SFI68945.1 hypothetical protein SAMN05216206_2752 [Pseudomonas guineae]
MANTTHSSAEIIKQLFTTEALAARPTAWFVAAHTGEAGIDASSNEVSTGSDANYARQAVTFATSVELGVTSAKNTADLAFPASAAAAPYTVRSVSIHTQSSGGIALAVLPLDPPRIVQPGGVLRFPINELIIEGFCHGD